MYEVTSDETLAQGDILLDFPLLVLQPPFDPETVATSPNVTTEVYDIIVLSQTCDLTEGKLDSVLVCPLFDVEEIILAIVNADSNKARESAKKQLEQGSVVSLYLIPSCEITEYESPCRVASFRQVAATPLLQVETHAKATSPRMRLLPPYREHLAQAFGRFVMRVGLPVPVRIA